MTSLGLSNNDAFAAFLKAFAEGLENFQQREHKILVSRPAFCFSDKLLWILGVLAVCIIIGAVDFNNTPMISLLLAGFLILHLSILLFVLKRFILKARRDYQLKRAKQAYDTLMKTDASQIFYPTLLEPPSEEWICQTVLRSDSINATTVPTILLAPGDILLLRPGQTSPCMCDVLDKNIESRIFRGEKLHRDIHRDPETGAAVPLDPVKCVVVEAPITRYLREVLLIQRLPSPLDHQISRVLHKVLCPTFLIASILLACALALMRFLFDDEFSLFSSRFIFSVPASTILPLLCPVFPVFYFVLILWNNAVVLRFIKTGKIKTSFCATIKSIVRNICDEKCFIFECTDLVATFGSMTAMCFVDKKGLVSSPNPQLDKIFFFSEEIDETDGTRGPASNILELSGLKNGDKWTMNFDDPSWDRYMQNLLPIGQNLAMNGCDDLREYNRFLDHATCVSETVPRTISVAARRCCCDLQNILEMEIAPQLLPSRSLGLYVRTPGQEPANGITRHRTPLESAFCKITPDSQSLHLHMACQGTAGVILEACSHAWVDNSVQPLLQAERHSAEDFYQRNSMTGYCLALSYKAVNSLPSNRLASQFIELGAGSRVCHESGDATLGARSHSASSLSVAEFFDSTEIQTAKDALGAYFQGQVFCGMVTLQYQADPLICDIFDAADASAIRFVYFSRENELRSRVFAEKLGLEAGWNCHISLAECDFQNRKSQIFAACYRPSRPKNESCVSLPVEIEPILAARGGRESYQSRRSFSKVVPFLNKAQLPQGVQAVRPHLEDIDNVPLQVGLFTDATPASTQEMLKIMNEYGEVLLIIGSSFNTSNAPIFNQGLASVCAEPLRDGIHLKEEQKPGINALTLATLCMECSATFALKHEQLAFLPTVISIARHRLFAIRSALQFLLFSCCSLTLLTALSQALFLPIIFLPDQIVLFCCVIFPVSAASTLSLSFSTDRKFVKIAGKNVDHVNKREIYTSIVTFGIQFFPNVAFTLIFYLFMLIRYVDFECEFSDVVCSSVDHIFKKEFESRKANVDLHIEEVRQLVALQFTVSVIVHAASWTFCLFPITSTRPFTHASWVTPSLLILFTQITFSNMRTERFLLFLISTLPLVVCLIWDIVLLCIQELRKRQQRRLFLREQRRRQLAFDTKLGMNSPY